MLILHRKSNGGGIGALQTMEGILIVVAAAGGGWGGGSIGDSEEEVQERPMVPGVLIKLSSRTSDSTCISFLKHIIIQLLANNKFNPGMQCVSM